MSVKIRYTKFVLTTFIAVVLIVLYLHFDRDLKRIGREYDTMLRYEKITIQEYVQATRDCMQERRIAYREFGAGLVLVLGAYCSANAVQSLRNFGNKDAR